MTRLIRSSILLMLVAALFLGCATGGTLPDPVPGPDGVETPDEPGPETSEPPGPELPDDPDGGEVGRAG